MFLSLPWPKTPLFTVFLNLLSKNTAICDVFNNMVAKNTAICEVFYIFAQRTQASAMYKTLQKPMFLPNKNGENRHPNSSEITKSGPPASRQGTWKKHLKPKSEDQQSKNRQVVFSTFLLPVPGGRMHELVHSVLQKKQCFLKSAVVTYQKPIVFAKKGPQEPLSGKPWNDVRKILLRAAWQREAVIGMCLCAHPVWEHDIPGHPQDVAGIINCLNMWLQAN